MITLRAFWNKFKTQPDIWFFFLFLLTFTLSVRKVLFYFPIQGTFNEYTGIYVYISDIFLFLTLSSWMILILYNINPRLSMNKLWITSRIHNLDSTIRRELKFLFPKYYYVSLLKNRSIFSKKHTIPIKRETAAEQSFSKSNNTNTPPIALADIPTDSVPQVEHLGLHGTRFFRVPQVIMGLWLIWAIISIKWSSNMPLALFRTIKVAEFLLLYLYFRYRIVPRGTITGSHQCSTCLPDRQAWNNSILIIISVATIQSIIAILQTLIQHSVGINWLKESLIAPNILGVAKIIIDGDTYIRAYGLFPHPNVLGGFLTFSIILTLWNHRNCSTWNNLSNTKQRRFPQKAKLVQFSLALQATALLFSVSKSAVLALFIAILYILYIPHRQPYAKNVPPAYRTGRRGTIWQKIMSSFDWHNVSLPFKKFNLNRSKMLLALIIILTFFIIKPDINSLVLQSLSERKFYLYVSRGTILDNPIQGEGIGQFVWNISQYTSSAIKAWQYQPVHNVFLLIWSELGLIGLSIFIWFLWRVFKMPKIRGDSYSILNHEYYILSISLLRYAKGLFLGLLFIMLFDHYLWDIQQGSFLFWMTLGIISGLNDQS